MTHLSLFSGIGGLDLAAEWAGFTTVGQCEWADYPTKVLEKHWPDVPRWRDIRTLTGDSFYARTGLRTVDVISGGFPCQPFSVAGKQKGKEDERYLWPEMLRVIREIKPRYVIGENVPGILRVAAADVVKDLERAGYHTVVFAFEAAAVGAPHRRERIAFVGYAEHHGSFATEELRSNEASSPRREKESGETWQSERTGRSLDVSSVSGCESGKHFGKRSEDVADAQRNGLRQDDHQSSPHIQRDDTAPKQVWGAELCQAGCCGSYVSNTNGTVQSIHMRTRGWWPGSGNTGWWTVEPDVGRVAHGIPHRVDRLKCLGNAVVPQQFYPIFKAIADIECGNVIGGANA